MFTWSAFDCVCIAVKYGEGTFEKEKILPVSVFECSVDTGLKGVI